MITVGLDVHKDTVFCAIHNGKKCEEVKEFSTLTCDIRAMGEYLQGKQAGKAAMESTGHYWIPVWNIPEDMGFELILVNPYLIKQMPGRKSDVKDAQWIATLYRKNTGTVDGEMVVQLYTRQLWASVTRPVKELKGFRKIALKAGETKQIAFELTAEEMAFYGVDGKKKAESGDCKLWIAQHAEDESNELNFEIMD